MERQAGARRLVLASGAAVARGERGPRFRRHDARPGVRALGDAAAGRAARHAAEAGRARPLARRPRARLCRGGDDDRDDRVRRAAGPARHAGRPDRRAARARPRGGRRDAPRLVGRPGCRAGGALAAADRRRGTPDSDLRAAGGRAARLRSRSGAAGDDFGAERAGRRSQRPLSTAGARRGIGPRRRRRRRLAQPADRRRPGRGHRGHRSRRRARG